MSHEKTNCVLPDGALTSTLLLFVPPSGTIADSNTSGTQISVGPTNRRENLSLALNAVCTVTAESTEATNGKQK